MRIRTCLDLLSVRLEVKWIELKILMQNWIVFNKSKKLQCKIISKPNGLVLFTIYMNVLDKIFVIWVNYWIVMYFCVSVALHLCVFYFSFPPLQQMQTVCMFTNAACWCSLLAFSCVFRRSFSTLSYLLQIFTNTRSYNIWVCVLWKKTHKKFIQRTRKRHKID